MHVSCTICGDIFTGIDPEVIRSTQCGHLFHHQCLTEWLNRSKTCPQCRSRVNEKSTVKLYVQLTSYPIQDTGTLENTVQNLRSQLKMKEMEISKLKDKNTEAVAKIKEAESRLLEFKMTLEEAEDKITKNHLIVNSLQDKIKILKMQTKSLAEEKERNDELKKRLEQYSSLEKILKGSADEAADILALMNDSSDPRILCACINTLKKELQNYKKSARESQNLLKFKESKLSAVLVENGKLEKQISILESSLTKLKEDLKHTENENESLKQKCKHLEEAIMSSQEGSSTSNPRDKALRRFINEYPTPILKESPTIEITLPSSSRTFYGSSPISPVRFRSSIDSKRLILNKRRMLSNSSWQEQPSYDGLGGRVKEEISLTDKATLKRALEKAKIQKILNPKRLKTAPKAEPSQSTLLNFCTKKFS